MLILRPFASIRWRRKLKQIRLLVGQPAHPFGGHRETYIPTPPHPPRPYPWISCSHGNRKWPQGAEPSPREGPSSPYASRLQKVNAVGSVPGRGVFPFPPPGEAGSGPPNPSIPSRELGSTAHSNKLAPTSRIKKRREFLRAERGIKLHSTHFVAWVIASDETSGESRLGITTSRKVGNAVTRNRVRRLVREVYRHQRWPCVDVVVVAKRNPTLCLQDVENELLALRRKIIERFGEPSVQTETAPLESAQIETAQKT